MNAVEVAAAAHAAGLQVLVDGLDLVVRPADRITPEVRSLLAGVKAEVVEHLSACQRITPMLLAAAMRVCDYYDDSEQARADMRAAVLDTPLYMRLDLMHHLQQTYPEARYCDKFSFEA
jgi:hypothetical protein